MKNNFQELMKDLYAAKDEKSVVTFIQIAGWLKATTGTITEIINRPMEVVVVVNNREFYLEEDDKIFIDDTQDKKYYGLECSDYECSLGIIL